MNVVILTPIPVEQHAILGHLTSYAEKEVGKSHYVVGEVKSKHGPINIALQLTGPGNTTVALAAEKAIRNFEPMVIILAGIAGGVKDVEIGDIAVGTKFYGYESGKETNEGFMVRPAAGLYSKDLVSIAEAVARRGDWKKRVKGDATKAKVIFGPIASGDKVIAAGDGVIANLLKHSYNDTTALEMESNGFGHAMQHHPGIRFMNIRGISDLLEGKAQTDKDGSRERAAEHMAGFVFELLSELDTSSFITLDMDVKTIVKEVYGLLFPAALKEIGSDFANATNNEIRVLWGKVKPLFITEVEKLAKDPENVDRQGAVRMKLADELEGKESLQRELEGLIEKIQKEHPSGFNNSGTIHVKDSKNVMIGGTISSGSNVHFGDIKNK
ncbi:MAG: hypothetical protein ACKV1O_28425 [Saprospiraceae bacterium]